ncbi:phospholipid/cholesterol/gamma-HCH transport system permease protein [Saccharopolyspora shandongensis]|uniref:Phospholipid/cholesterol/gamma-HCH transport system permease protein n=1 Tax=Saccharopolyspora shandongensis TaxID=418495 RepID=A0A1H3Q6N3_9PSEU|nr:ABC transporter permease [Saccharopolyspora shandongensis]SDZ09164.1 phospholipid/cholesterol/gamma-HCH transport system permease protein [Saccharopolyspora shandongensis]
MYRGLPTVRGPISDALLQTGLLLDFAVRTAAAAFRSVRRARFSWTEFLQQAWFLAAVTTLPALLVTIPLGVVVALNVGSLAGQLGAQGYGGAVVAFVIVGQAAPLICALMISGVGGSAMCSDLGARKIREEVDALEVMALPVIERLVVPRVVAAAVVNALLACIVLLVGIATTFLFQVWVLGDAPGAFLRTLTQFSRVPDFVVALLKAAVFAVLTALVSCFKGLTAKGGPGGVGTAVNEAVVISFILVFVANTVITELYPVLVPAKGEY